MVHCSFDFLQGEFNKTFRRQNEDETVTSIITRHSHFANWARLLRECVECFGIKDSKDYMSGRLQLYFGLSKTAMFSSTRLCINAPLSTTLSYSVAIQFTNNQGIIVILNTTGNWFTSGNNLCCFECMFVSPYSQEYEVFFMGGYSTFEVQTIKTLDGQDYQLFVHALSLFADICSAYSKISDSVDRYHDLTISVVRTAFRIASDYLSRIFPADNSHESFPSMDPYMKQLTQSTFENIRRMWLFGVNMESEWISVFKGLFFDCGYIRLDRLILAFPNLEEITLIEHCDNDRFLKMENIYLSTLHLLQNSAEIVIPRIRIAIPKKLSVVQCAKHIIAKYHEPFIKAQCIIRLDNIAEHDYLFLVMERLVDFNQSTYQRISASMCIPTTNIALSEIRHADICYDQHMLRSGLATGMTINVEFSHYINLHSIMVHTEIETISQDRNDILFIKNIEAMTSNYAPWHAPWYYELSSVRQTVPMGVHIYKTQRYQLLITAEDLSECTWTTPSHRYNRQPDKMFRCSTRHSQVLHLNQKDNDRMNFAKTRYLMIYISSSTHIKAIQFLSGAAMETECITNLYDISEHEPQSPQLIKTKLPQNINRNSKYLSTTIQTHFDGNTFMTGNVISYHDHCKISQNECESEQTFNDALVKSSAQDERLNNTPNMYMCREMKCEAFKHIINLSHGHHDHINDETLQRNDLIGVLNDFNHVLDHHPDAFTMNNRTRRCGVDHCSIIRRNYKNRFSDSLHGVSETSCYDTDCRDIVNIQILDRLHTYCYHTFDEGRRIASVYNRQNQKRYRKTLRSHSFDKELKYKTGMRYYYWDYFKDNISIIDPTRQIKNDANASVMIGEVYVPPKFANLKAEVINNEICTISSSEWNVIIAKAHVHKETNHYKAMACNASYFKQYYDISEGTPISVQHIAAMMLYCNKDALQRRFSETIWDVQLNEKHRNYHHLAKLLRENVEVFGSNNIALKNVSLYHGVALDSQFSSLDICFNGPLSSTTSYEVAAGFAMGAKDGEGMVLEFTLNDDWVSQNNKTICLFQCAYVSDYPCENEIFFIGGLANFQFESIQKTIGTRYTAYVLALIAISDFCNGYIRWLKRLNRSVLQKLICRVLSYQFHRKYSHDEYNGLGSIDSYTKGMIERHFDSIHRISLFGLIYQQLAMFKLLNKTVCSDKHPLMLLVNKSMETKFREYFMDECGWLNLRVLVKVFPYLNEITLIDKKDTASFIENESIYDSVLELLKRIPNKLSKISIAIPRTADVKYKTDAIQRKYADQFKQFHWDLSIEQCNRTLTDKYMLFVMGSINHSVKRCYN
eukprot:15036_1